MISPQIVQLKCLLALETNRSSREHQRLAERGNAERERESEQSKAKSERLSSWFVGFKIQGRQNLRVTSDLAPALEIKHVNPQPVH
eukprot:2181199-Rhodomonas_salina.4